MDVEEFAIAFTIAVTEVSDSAADLVAKNGIHSIFSVLQGIFPQESAISISTNQILDYDLILSRRYALHIARKLDPTRYHGLTSTNSSRIDVAYEQCGKGEDVSQGLCQKNTFFPYPDSRKTDLDMH